MPGPTTAKPPATPYISFSEIERRVRSQELREALRKFNVPDATADQVFQRQRHQASYVGLSYVGSVLLQYITGTTTTFDVWSGDRYRYI
jgi:hypothetical protein